MQPHEDDNQDLSRRSFLRSGGSLLTSIWVASHWPAIAAAAHHADDVSGGDAPQTLEYFNVADAADVEAVGAQIIPSGATPGAREAHAIYFIDRSLKTYFAAMAPDFHTGLKQFQDQFHAAYPQAATFAAAAAGTQIDFLKTVDRTPFFDMTRMLTVLGMFSSPKYGGNYQGSGWKMMGFVDQHAFTPPFGYYDAEYTGFVPYPAKDKA